MRLRLLGLLGLCLSGCFLDAMGVPGDGGAPATGAGGETTTTTTSTPTSTATTGGAGEGGAGGDEGGGGALATGGGGASEGGAPPCVGYLALDADQAGHDRAEIGADVAFDDPDDFAFGATLRLTAVPDSFDVDDDDYSAAYIFEHDDGQNGFTLGLTERYDGDVQGDDGKPHLFVAVHANGDYCDARADAELALGVWHRVAGTYVASTGTISLYVDGVAIDSDSCNDVTPAPVGAVTTPFAIGSAGFGIAGDVDDVFFRSTATIPPDSTPITCSAGTIAAFDFDGSSLATVCPQAHAFMLFSTPNDPMIVCP